MKFMLLSCFIAVIWAIPTAGDSTHPNCLNNNATLDRTCPPSPNAGCKSNTVLTTTLEDLRGVFVAMIDILNIEIEGSYEPRPPPCLWPQDCGPQLPGFGRGCSSSSNGTTSTNNSSSSP